MEAYLSATGITVSEGANAFQFSRAIIQGVDVVSRGETRGEKG